MKRSTTILLCIALIIAAAVLAGFFVAAGLHPIQQRPTAEEVL